VIDFDETISAECCRGGGGEGAVSASRNGWWRARRARNLPEFAPGGWGCAGGVRQASRISGSLIRRAALPLLSFGQTGAVMVGASRRRLVRSRPTDQPDQEGAPLPENRDQDHHQPVPLRRISGFSVRKSGLFVPDLGPTEDKNKILRWPPKRCPPLTNPDRKS